MCLYNGYKIQVSEDIVCYKLLEICDNGTLRSLFMASPYTIGKVKIQKNKEVLTMRDPMGGNRVGAGALHSFVNYADALQESYEYHPSFHVVIAKCIIPKNSEFIYKGVWSTHNRPCYASRKLKVIEIIDEQF